jgi:hypothetical protein
MLLFALLPERVVDKIRQDASHGGLWHSNDADSKSAFMLSDTPAKRMLRILGCILEGMQPAMQDVAMVRSALLQCWNIYVPPDLGETLATMNVEVGHAV